MKNNEGSIKIKRDRLDLEKELYSLFVDAYNVRKDVFRARSFNEAFSFLKPPQDNKISKKGTVKKRNSLEAIRELFITNLINEIIIAL